MLHESSLGPNSCSIDLLYFAQWLFRGEHQANRQADSLNCPIEDQPAEIVPPENESPFEE